MKWKVWIAALLTFAFLFVLVMQLEVYNNSVKEVIAVEGFGGMQMQEQTVKTWGIGFKWQSPTERSR